MQELIILLSILTILSVVLSRRRWYAPAVLQSAVWWLCVVAYAVIDRGMHPLTPVTCRAIMIWVGGFCLSTWVVQALYTKPLLKDVEASQPVRDMYFYLTLLTLPVMIWKVVMVVMHTGGNPFSALRDANVRANSEGIRTIGFFVVFWMVSYLLELRQTSKLNLRRVVVLAMINLFYVVVSMGKMNMMIWMLSTAIVLSEKGKIRIRHLILALPILMMAFVGVQTIRGSKMTTEDFAALYMTSSIGNLNTNVTPCSAKQPGENTFRLYYAIRSKMDGGKTKVIDPILDFKEVGIGRHKFSSNTYTALYPFFTDFGLTGVAVVSVLLGLLFGSIFKLAEDGCRCALVVYALWAGTVVMQVVGDTFITILSQNLQYLIAAILPYVMSKYRLMEK